MVIKQLRVSFLFILLMWTSACSNKTNQVPNHIVIVMEENTNFGQLMGNEDAPYINSLAKQGRFFTNSHGVAHPSQPNYIALFSGSPQGVKDDRCLKDDSSFTTPNLGHELLSNGYSFAGYSESMPETGFTGCYKEDSSYPNGSPLYARKHNPWVNWQGDSTNSVPAGVNLRFKDFPTDYNDLPTVAFVIPNEDNDMHNGPDSLRIKRGDTWLKNNMNNYVEWAKNHNSLFILTYDEDDSRPKNHIATIFVGAQIQPGKVNSTINHFNVLRTIEKWYGLLNTGAADEQPITGIWNAQ